VARQITYQDEINPDIRYILARIKFDKPDLFGGVRAVGWLGINCRTKQMNSNSYFSVNQNGAVIGVMGNEGNWLTFADSSPTSNAYVMLCDRP
jgi:hypothetical protein